MKDLKMFQNGQGILYQRKVVAKISNFSNKFGWVGCNSISTIVGYLIPNPLYTYILNIYDLIWLGVIAYQPL